MIRKIISEQITRYAHPMNMDRVIDMFKPQLEGGNKNKWREFRGAVNHIIQGVPNDMCGCNSFMPGPGDGKDNPGGGGGL